MSEQAAISIMTVIVIGGILYAFSGMVRRAHGAGPISRGAPRRETVTSAPSGKIGQP